MTEQGDSLKNKEQTDASNKLKNHSTAKQQRNTVALIVFVVIVMSFIVAPIIGFSASGGINQLEFGRYGSRPVSYTQGSYFASLVERNRTRMPANLTGYIAYSYFRANFEESFRAAMMREAWIYQADRAGVQVSPQMVALALREQGLTDNIISQFDRTQRNEIFQNALADQRIGRLQAGLFDDIQRDELSRQLIVNPLPLERKALVAYFPLSAVDDNFLVNYALEHPLATQRWVLRRYVQVGDLALAEATYEELTQGNTTINELTLEQRESPSARYRDAYAEFAGLMPAQLLYQLAAELELTDEQMESILTPLIDGGVSRPLAFNRALLGTEAYMFVQVEQAPSTLNVDTDERRSAIEGYLADNTYRQALLQHVMQADDGLLTEYFGALASAVNEQNFRANMQLAGAQVVESDFFPMVYGMDMRTNYSPYRGKITQFESAFAEASSEISSGVLTSDHFFRAAFAHEVGRVSDAILLPSGGVVFVLPVDERVNEESLAFDDWLYMEYFLVMQAQNSAEEQFKLSSRYKDQNFERAFANVANRMGLSSELVFDESALN